MKITNQSKQVFLLSSISYVYEKGWERIKEKLKHRVQAEKEFKKWRKKEKENIGAVNPDKDTKLNEKKIYNADFL